MEQIAFTASTSGAAKPASETKSKTKTEKAGEQSFAKLFAEAEKKLHDGEKLERVKGHSYARIEGGARNDEFVNLSGNARSGQVFDVVTRGGHTYHVYGHGKNRVVVEVGRHKATGGTQAS